MHSATPIIHVEAPIAERSLVVRGWVEAPAWVGHEPVVLIPRRSVEPADPAARDRRSGVIRAVTSDLPRLSVAAEWESEALFAHVGPRLMPNRGRRGGRTP